MMLESNELKERIKGLKNKLENKDLNCLSQKIVMIVCELVIQEIDKVEDEEMNDIAEYEKSRCTQ